MDYHFSKDMKFYLRATLYESECAINVNILFSGSFYVHKTPLFLNNLFNIKATIYFGIDYYGSQVLPHIFSSDINVSEM